MLAEVTGNEARKRPLRPGEATIVLTERKRPLKQRYTISRVFVLFSPMVPRRLTRPAIDDRIAGEPGCDPALLLLAQLRKASELERRSSLAGHRGSRAGRHDARIDRDSDEGASRYDRAGIYLRAVPSSSESRSTYVSSLADKEQGTRTTTYGPLGGRNDAGGVPSVTDRGHIGRVTPPVALAIAWSPRTKGHARSTRLARRRSLRGSP